MHRNYFFYNSLLLQWWIPSTRLFTLRVFLEPLLRERASHGLLASFFNTPTPKVDWIVGYRFCDAHPLGSVCAHFVLVHYVRCLSFSSNLFTWHICWGVRIYAIAKQNVFLFDVLITEVAIASVQLLITIWRDRQIDCWLVWELLPLFYLLSVCIFPIIASRYLFVIAKDIFCSSISFLALSLICAMMKSLVLQIDWFSTPSHSVSWFCW